MRWREWILNNKKKGKIMLVIHPTDRTTEMLSILYEGLEARLIEADCSNKEMGNGADTDKESMDRTNRIMFTQLRRLLDNGTPLHEIPERLKALDTTQSELSRFNYERFYCL